MEIKSYDCVFSIMVFPTLVRRHIYIESGPWTLSARQVIMQDTATMNQYQTAMKHYTAQNMCKTLKYSIIHLVCMDTNQFYLIYWPVVINSTSFTDLLPVPLTIFRSNLKFDQTLQCSGFKCTLLITTKFCTRHDSVTVVTCAKFCCDQLSIF